MKTAVIHLDVKPEKISEFKKQWSMVSEEAKKEKGLLNAFLLVNPQNGRSLSIGLWENEADAKAFSSKPVYQKFVTDIKDYLVKPPVREYYDMIGELPEEFSKRKIA